MEYLLTTDQLTKRYRKVTALRNVSIHVKQGAIYGLIGRNGAGKTTLMKILSGLAGSTSGSFQLFGENSKQATRQLGRIGSLIESTGFYPNMNAMDHLKLKCLAMGVRSHTEPETLLEQVGLSGTGKKKVKQFSMGMKQRL
ncbi:MAG: ATP-binding cassette domain-containing protein, partial [Lachnospiraceae bacterium]|nr:ATP-binding cassette domain-containing protein [Lachnospiraceae bacterium]